CGCPTAPAWARGTGSGSAACRAREFPWRLLLDRAEGCAAPLLRLHREGTFAPMGGLRQPATRQPANTRGGLGCRAGVAALAGLAAKPAEAATPTSDTANRNVSMDGPRVPARPPGASKGC